MTGQRSAGYFREEDCALSEFRDLTSRSISPEDAPSAARIAANVPVYEVAALGDRLEDDTERRTLMAEWAGILGAGPGVFVLKRAVTDIEALDAATAAYHAIIAAEKDRAGGGADHFAASGANDRVWNSLQKLGETAPEVFVRYFAPPPSTRPPRRGWARAIR